jgi:type VI protein secretion system component VasK
MYWNNFWDVVWFFFWTFAFIAYLIALFSIIGDLFRDHKLNGWFKAIWILFLLFVPFLTALVYLIARGRGMAERTRASQQQADAQAKDYLRSAVGVGASDEIAKAKSLLDAGTISQSEFDAIKSRALA